MRGSKHAVREAKGEHRWQPESNPCRELNEAEIDSTLKIFKSNTAIGIDRWGFGTLAQAAGEVMTSVLTQAQHHVMARAVAMTVAQAVGDATTIQVHLGIAQLAVDKGMG